MKTIINKLTSLSNGKEEGTLSYNDFLKTIMNIAPKDGYTISEMRQRLKIYAELEPDSNNNINLEDIDFVVVKTCVQAFKWGIANKEVVEFVDHIESL